MILIYISLKKIIIIYVDAVDNKYELNKFCNNFIKKIGNLVTIKINFLKKKIVLKRSKFYRWKSIFKKGLVFNE